MVTKKKTAAKTSHKGISCMSSTEFAARKFPLRWLVESVLVSRQPAVLGGPKKTMKTSLLVDLVISLGSGTPFLGKFRIPKRRAVLMLSGESGKGTLQETAERICQSKGIELSTVNAFWGFELPELSTEKSLSSLQTTLKSKNVEVVCIDPLYLCLGHGVSPSNLYEVGPVLRNAAQACLRAGATPIIVHHARKQDNKAKAAKPLDLDDLAFAGIAEFARQWVLINRRKPYQVGSGNHELLMSLGGSAGHSALWSVDINEKVINDNLRGREWHVEVFQKDSNSIHKRGSSSRKLHELDYVSQA